MNLMMEVYMPHPHLWAVDDVLITNYIPAEWVC